MRHATYSPLATCSPHAGPYLDRAVDSYIRKRPRVNVLSQAPGHVNTLWYMGFNPDPKARRPASVVDIFAHLKNRLDPGLVHAERFHRFSHWSMQFLYSEVRWFAAEDRKPTLRYLITVSFRKVWRSCRRGYALDITTMCCRRRGACCSQEGARRGSAVRRGRNPRRGSGVWAGASGGSARASRSGHAVRTWSLSGAAKRRSTSKGLSKYSNANEKP